MSFRRQGFNRKMRGFRSKGKRFKYVATAFSIFKCVSIT